MRVRMPRKQKKPGTRSTRKTAPPERDNAVSNQAQQSVNRTNSPRARKHAAVHATARPQHPQCPYASNANSYRPQAAAIMITSYAAAMPHELQNVPNVPSTPINATVVAETHA